MLAVSRLNHSPASLFHIINTYFTSSTNTPLSTGPTGGGYCTNDRTYSDTVLQPFFTNSPFVPKKFVNPNATVAAMR